MERNYYVYILASKKNGTLHIGMTQNLLKRVWQHQNKVAEGFTEKYSVAQLVYYEVFIDPVNAIKREKRLKKYPRKWKMNLIEKENPEWLDLTAKWNTGLPEQVGQ